MRHIVSSIPSKLQSVARDRDGSMAMIFAVATTAVALTVGAAIDYSMASRVRGAAETALDSASLSVAKLVASGESDQTKLDAEGRTVFDANFAPYLDRGYEPTAFAVSKPSPDNKVTVSAAFDVPTSFMQLAGVKTVPVAAASTSHTGNIVEVSMMLDLTGSMDWSVKDASGKSVKKIRALETTAKSAVNQLLDATKSSDKMRIALVPFSYGLNAGSAASAATKGASTACVHERIGAEAATGASPDVAPVVPGKNCPGRAVVPLTNDRAALLKALDNLPASGSTAGALGTAWSYYVLSDKWKNVFPAASAPKPASTPDLEKFAILMTDGQYNTFKGVNLEKKPDEVDKIEALSVDLCTSMKKDGIKVFAVGFDIAGTHPLKVSARETLEACASVIDGKPAFYNASSPADLQAAYDDIVRRILAIRIAA